jgi:ParB family chromosome partitioning protein
MGRKALGKGLKALIPDIEDTSKATANSVLSLKVSEIVANPYQPRREFDSAKLNDLTESIKEQGVVQPVLVRPVGNSYELIAGERRLQAVKMAGFDEIPAIVREADNREMLEIALIENIQREDLNPIDEALAYQQLMTEFNLTQAEISKRVAKDRSTLANAIRLLKLPQSVQAQLSAGLVTVGHSRALLALPTTILQEKYCDKIVQKGLTVRDTEKLVRRELEVAQPRSTQSTKDAHIRRIEEQLQQHLGTKVDIHKRGQKGQVRLEFYSWKDLERILDLIGVSISD